METNSTLSKILVLRQIAAVLLAVPISAQVYGVAWGATGFDTRCAEGVFVQVDAATSVSVQLRQDGAVFTRGGYAQPAPDLPHGVWFLRVAVGGSPWFAAVRSDGGLDYWGGWNTLNPATGQPYVVPALPAGVTYVDVAVSQDTVSALRSDGEIVCFGYYPYFAPQFFQVPPRSPGTVWTKLRANDYHVAALTSSGQVYDWGRLPVPIPPPPPPGVHYVDVAPGVSHLLCLRSDGLIDASGTNLAGETSVPPLPPGLFYTAVAAGERFSGAQRSDGTWVLWGENADGQCNIQPLPAGLRYNSMALGRSHTVALRSDGQVTGWGYNAGTEAYLPPLPPGTVLATLAGSEGHYLTTHSDGSLQAFGVDWLSSVPALPSGLRYLAGITGYAHNMALRSDGALIAWGDNSQGQCNVPLLPPGVRYEKVDAAYTHSVVLRSDGQALILGNSGSINTVPPLLPGTRYTDVGAFPGISLFVRSDGEAVAVGNNFGGRLQVPPPPPGRGYRKACAGRTHAAGLLDDGSLVQWGTLPQVAGVVLAPPPLPPGVVYVDVKCCNEHSIARRSDGQLVHWGDVQILQNRIPPLPPGFSALSIECGLRDVSVALYGPASTYVTFASGCAGSLPAARLIPFDTPRIGRRLEVKLLDLPRDIAFVVMGWTRPAQPIPLAGFGMPGCAAAVTADGVLLVGGNQRSAVWRLDIPYSPALVGLRFYNQALVPDPAAGNPLGGVLSDAAEGVVGF